MPKNTVLKIAAFVAILAIIEVSSGMGVFADQNSSDKAFDRFVNQQVGAFGASWLIMSVANDNIHNIAANNAELRNNIENNLKTQAVVETGEEKIPLQGPRAGNDNSEAKTANGQGIIDKKDYAKIKTTLLDNDSNLGKEIRSNLEVWLRKHPISYATYATKYDPNFDFNDDNRTNATDEIMIRYGDPRVLPKIMAAVEARMGATAGDENFAPLFDIDSYNGAANIDTEKSYGVFIDHDYNRWLVMLSDRIDKNAEKSNADKVRLFNDSDFNEQLAREKNIIIFKMNENLKTDLTGNDEAGDIASRKASSGSLKIKMRDEGDLEAGKSNLKDKKDEEETADKVRVAEEIITESRDYIDDTTMKEFEEAIRLVDMAESFKDILEDVDFTAVTFALDELTWKQRSLYNEYLSKTEKIYDYIVSLLKVNIEELTLPDRYLVSPNLGQRERKKILADIILRDITARDKKVLTGNEKEALLTYEKSLLPLQDKYREDLKSVIGKFIFEVKTAIVDKMPASVSNDDGQFKGLFILSSKKE